MNNKKLLAGGAVILAGLLLGGCGKKEVGYQADVQPILKKYCMECHVEGGDGYLKSGLSMTSYENLMKGTKFGPVIKPGDPLTSTLNMLVEGRADPSLKMPHSKEPLSAAHIETLKNWVAQGAKNN